MTKSQLIAALSAIPGDPEVRLRQNLRMSLPIVAVREKPDGDYNGGGMTYQGRWHTTARYIQLQQGRDEETMVFV